jgi:glutamine amidotransferase
VIALINYRAGNTASVLKAFQFVGAEAVVTSEPAVVRSARAIVLPGVGHFASTTAIEDLGLSAPILDSISSGKPFLGICVGMQWIFAGSTESESTRGLGLLVGECQKFSSDVKSPHVGWNRIRKLRESRLLHQIDDEAFFYYTHSYRVPVYAECVAVTEYGGEFAAVVECANVFGVQFHPEKSGDAGLQLLNNFAELAC